MGLSSYGELAARYAGRYDAATALVVIDASGAAAGLEEAIRRRRGNEPFAVTIVHGDPYARAAAQLAPQLLAAEQAYDRRRMTFEAVADRRLTVNGQPLEALAGDAPQVLVTLSDAIRAADVWLARSWQELADLQRRLRVRHPRAAAAPSPAAAVGGPRGGGSGILVYAPRLPAVELLTIAFGLAEHRARVTIACASHEQGAQFGLPATFVSPDQIASLQGIGAVLAADPSDPADALDAAAWNIPLAVADSSGAHEYLWNALTFTPYDFRSVFVAAQNALGSDPPRRREPQPSLSSLLAWLDAARPVAVASQPLVSIIVPTKNRPLLLRRLFASLRAQTYENTELIVVNDGGVDIAEIVGEVAGATLITNPSSTGVIAATRSGLDRANGTYTMVIADDDVIYPDHLARSVAALERTGGAVARSLMVTGYRSLRDGRYVSAGYAINPPGVDPTETLSEYSVGSLALVERTDVYRRMFYDERFGFMSDWEMMLRIMREHDVICIPVATREQDLRDDGSQLETSASVEKQLAFKQALYEAHPAVDRPSVAERRRVLLEHLATHGPGKPVPPLFLEVQNDVGYGPEDLKATT